MSASEDVVEASECIHDWAPETLMSKDGLGVWLEKSCLACGTLTLASVD